MAAETQNSLDNSPPIDILLQGVEMWNEWREQTGAEAPDLRNANLSGANLSGADLHGADLTGALLLQANLIGAYLSDAKLIDAHLDSADLRDATLRRTDLSNARLRKADFGDAILRLANLRGANLIDANLRGANLTEASFVGANLRGASLRGANLFGANLRDANLTNADIFGANLNGASLSSSVESEVVLGAEQQKSVLTIRLTKEPLTTRSLTQVFSALSDLHAQFWFLKEGRYDDFVNFSEGVLLELPEEAELVISGLRKNSPTESDFEPKEGTIRAITSAVETAYTLAEKKRHLKAETDAFIEKAKDEHLKSEADLRHTNELAEIQREREKITAEKEALQREREALELQRERAKVRSEIINKATEDAASTVDRLSPNLSASKREKAIRLLAQNLLKLYLGEDIELVRPLPAYRTSN
ncbi:secreted effector protein PipB2 [Abditibacteriota bacterium]|nr:secreted effector protein PipB2 [Abditibacteriota bacterium]